MAGSRLRKIGVAAAAVAAAPSISTATGSYAGGTWTIGSLAPGASATLTITGQVGNVTDGTQTVTATVSATTPDPDQANNIASASEATQPAPVVILIEGDPANPPIIDISDQGTASWLGEALNAPNANLWPADSTFVWSCSTASGDACPEPAATSATSFSSTIAYTMQEFSVDTYTLTLTVSWTDPNYAMPGGATSTDYQVTFITTNNGG